MLWKRVLVTGIILALTALVVFRFGEDWKDAALLARRAQVGPLCAVFLCQLAYFVTAGVLVRQCLRLVDFEAPFWWTVQATFLLIILSRIVPGPAATGPAAMYYLLERRGLGRTRSAIVGPLFYVVDFGMYFVLLGVGLALLALRRQESVAPAVVLPLLAGVAALAGFALWLLGHPARIEAVLNRLFRAVNRGSAALRLRRRVPDTAASGFAATLTEIVQRWRSHPHLRWRLLLAGMGMPLLDAATMAFAFRAFGVGLPTTTVIVGYCMATLGALFSFLPGGFGTFEAAMFIGFGSLGAPHAAILAATLVYRAAGTALPALLGLFAYRALIGPREPAGPEETGRAAPS